jgi:addiction module HigA family antidote
MSVERRPTHPGAVLREDVLPASGLSVSEMARRLHISRQTLHRILAEEQPVSAATALKLARLFGTSPESWLNRQRELDLWEESRRLAEELAKIEQVAA